MGIFGNIEVFPELIGQYTGFFDYQTMEGYERNWTKTIGEVAYSHGVFDIKHIDYDGKELWMGITAMDCLTDMLSE